MTIIGLPSAVRPRGSRVPPVRWIAATLACLAAMAAGVATARAPMLALLLAGLVAGAVMLLRPMLATLVVVALLYSNAPGIAVQVHGVPPSMAAAPLLLLAVPLAWWLVVRRERFVVSPVLYAVLAFTGAQIIATIWSQSPRESFTELSTSVTEGLLLFIAITNVVRTRTMLRHVVGVLLAVGALLGALSFFQQATGAFDREFLGFAQVSEAAFRTGPDTLAGTPTQPRLAGPVDEENRYAQILLVLVPLGAYRAWGDRRTGARLLAAGATVLITLGVILTFSRGAAIALLALLLVLPFTRFVTPKKTIGTLAVIGIVLTLVPSYRARVDTILTVPAAISADTNQPGASSVRSRLTENAAAALVFADEPFTGVGLGRFRDNYRRYADEVGIRVLPTERTAHNLYLGIAAETGIIGLLTFLAVLGVSMRELERVRRSKDRAPELSAIAAASMLAIGLYALSGMFLHLAFVRYFWLLVALAASVGAIARREAGARAGGRTG